MSSVFRPYQTEADARTREAIRQCIAEKLPPWVLLVMPTGGGKTTLFADGLVAGAVAKGSRAWIVTPPNKELVSQASKKLDKLGIPHGVLQGDHYRTNYAAKVQVCSIATAVNRLEKFKDAAPDLVVLDEAHHAVPGTRYQDLHEWLPEKTSVVGYTATPVRLDGTGMKHFFSKMVVASTIKELIRQGYLLPTEVYHAKVSADLSGMKKGANGDWAPGELGERMSQPKILGDIVAEWKEKGQNRPTLCFASTIEHSKKIVDAFKNAGIAAIHLDGDSDSDERRRGIDALKRGDVKIVSNCGLFFEGFDCPAVGCTIMARPTESLQIYMQTVGRGMRPEFGTARPGEYAILLDHTGNSRANKHGLPDKLREWSLEDGIKREPTVEQLILAALTNVGHITAESLADRIRKPVRDVEAALAKLIRTERVRTFRPSIEAKVLYSLAPVVNADDDDGDLVKDQVVLDLGDDTPLEKAEAEEDMFGQATDERGVYAALVEEAIATGRDAWYPSNEFRKQFGRSVKPEEEYEWSGKRLNAFYNRKTNRYDRRWNTAKIEAAQAAKESPA